MKDTERTRFADTGTRSERATDSEGAAAGSAQPCGISEVIAVLFDFDGVLVDSGAAHRESWKIAFRAVLGRDMPDYSTSEITGMSTIEIGRSLAQKAGTPEKAQALAEAKIQEIVYGDLLPGLLPGAREATEA
ncbi:MAG: HAD hydrolase-like protein, partial [Spirochaetia bacterium]